MQMHCLFWAVHMGITLGRGRGQQREYFQQKSRRGRAIFCKIRGGGAGEEVILLPKKRHIIWKLQLKSPDRQYSHK